MLILPQTCPRGSEYQRGTKLKKNLGLYLRGILLLRSSVIVQQSFREQIDNPRSSLVDNFSPLCLRPIKAPLGTVWKNAWHRNREFQTRRQKVWVHSQLCHLWFTFTNKLLDLLELQFPHPWKGDIDKDLLSEGCFKDQVISCVWTFQL